MLEHDGIYLGVNCKLCVNESYISSVKRPNWSKLPIIYFKKKLHLSGPTLAGVCGVQTVPCEITAHHHGNNCEIIVKSLRTTMVTTVQKESF